MPHPSTRVEVDCENCGKTLDLAKSDAERSDNNFCGRDCFNEWHTGENNHQFNEARTTVKCDNCGDKIERYRSLLNEHNFCDKSCQAEWQKKDTFGSKFYRTSQWENKREEIRNRDNNQCVWCGSQNNLHVHHLIPFSSGGSHLENTNLVTLCQTCHTVAHKALTV